MVFLVAMLSVSETVETKKTMRPHSMMWGLVWVVTQKVVEVTSRSTFLPFMEILLQPLDWYECHCTGSWCAYTDVGVHAAAPKLPMERGSWMRHQGPLAGTMPGTLSTSLLRCSLQPLIL